MCWRCDDPDTDPADYLHVLRGVVARQGYAVQAVRGSRSGEPFAYTIGRTAQGLPELLVIGARSDEATALLHHVVHHAGHETVSAGSHLDLPGWCLDVVTVTRPDDVLLLAVDLYGPDRVSALQLVWADDRGRWPWEVGFRVGPHHGEGRLGQPVLGTPLP